MTAATDYLENAVLDHILGTSAMTSPANIYVQLHTGAPGEAGTANVATESTRVLVTFGAAAGGSAQNDIAVEWAAVAATEDFTHWTLHDALVAGNVITQAPLDATESVLIGQTFRFEIGDLTVTAD